MMKKRNLLRKPALILVICCLIAFMLPVEIDASQLAQVSLRGSNDLKILQRGGFDIANISRGSLAQVILMSQEERRRLNETGLRYYILHEDLEGYFRSRLEPNRDDMGGYMTLDEIEERMFQIYDEFPDIVSEPVAIGQTIEERDILAFKVSDNPEDNEDEPEVLYTAAIHPREVITPLILFGFIDILTENYEEDDFLTYLVDEREMWFIPCHNPDGYAYNEETDPDGGGMWRKNRRDNGNGIYGVDLNRNYGHEWGYDDVGSSDEPADPTYRGEEPFSEPETQTVREFVNNNEFRTSLFFHAWGDLYLYPFGFDYIQAPDRSVLTALSQRMSEDNGYDIGTGWEIIYLTNGDSDDWLYASDEHDPIMAITPEVGNFQDYFWPELDRVETLVDDNITACIAAAEFADNPHRTLRPPAPLEVSVHLDQRNEMPIISWTPVEDEDNPAVSYKVRAVLTDEPIFDDAPEDQELWDLKHFSQSEVDRHSGTHSYRVQTMADIAYLTLREAIPAPDTMWAWVNYELMEFLDHYLALEISYGGYDWEPLSGQLTTDLVINDQNLGPGITGNSEGWVRTWWTTDEHEGEVVKFRFRYYQFGTRRQNEMCFIDEIGPLPAYEMEIPFVEVIEDTFYVDEDLDPMDGLAYQVRTLDAEDDLSFWTAPVLIGEIEESFTLTLVEGWNQVGIPLMPSEPALSGLLNELLIRDILIVVKNGAGELFLPREELDDIGTWDPLSGYQIKVEEDFQLVVWGNLVPGDTLIPLDEDWNLISYLPEEPLPVGEALGDLGDNVSIVKDGWGDFWVPEYDFDILGDMEPGEGYFLRLNEADTLTYPLPERFAGVRSENWIRTQPDGQAISPDNHSILIEFRSDLPKGEILLLDEDGFIAGRVSVEGSAPRAGLAAWGEESMGGTGYAIGEAIHAEFHPEGEESAYNLKLNPVKGDLNFSPNAFTVFEAGLELDELLPVGFETLESYPNPFNGFTSLRFSTPVRSHASLEIVDLSGRQVANLLSSSVRSGSHEIRWDASNLPSGLYVARLRLKTQFEKSIIETKLVLLR